MIRVTEDDIAKGEPYDRCPVYLALKRTFPKRKLAVGPGYVEISNRTGTFTISLCKSVKGFISAFDLGEKVEPFSFRIHLQ